MCDELAKLLEPVFASILGLFFFTEVPSLTSCLGGVMIIVGISIYSLKENEVY